MYGREPQIENSPPPSPSPSSTSLDLGRAGYNNDWDTHSRNRSDSASSRESHTGLMGLGYSGGGSRDAFGSGSRGGGGGGATRETVDGWRRAGDIPSLPSLGLQEDGSRIELLLPGDDPEQTPTPSTYSFQKHAYTPSYPSTSSRSSYYNNSTSNPDGGRYRAGPASISSSASIMSKAPTLAEKFDPTYWDLRPTSGKEAEEAEADDWLHNVNGENARDELGAGTLCTPRGFMNLGCLFILVVACFMLFAGYPIITELTKVTSKTSGAFNLGGTNQSGQVPETIGNFGLIDPATPSDAYTRVGLTGANTGVTYDLVFSDEFEVDGRSFYDGDDPYWTAADLHYWATNNLEWYDPRRVTTANGTLVITLDQADPDTNHNLNYTGGMITTWNKFCFTGGYFETKLRLPGSPKVWGLWPAVWAMGNLGRAGYGATLDGLWPYTYDTCDLGTLPNQTHNSLPASSLTDGLGAYNYALSYLPGQRLSACTCASDSSHPGPKVDGVWVGRGAPEIDMFEAQVDQTTETGHLSMSGQWAPFNAAYQFLNTSETYEIFDPDLTYMNTYIGGAIQQSTSAIFETNQACYQHPNGDTTGEGCFDVYGFEYKTGNDGYITWTATESPVWTVYQAALGPDATSEVSTRIIPAEPMYLLVNLGISENFGAVDYAGLNKIWPAVMEVEYVRVYQPTDSKNIGCDPNDFPTAKYIQDYAEMYSNPNMTTFAQAGYDFPLNNMVDTC